MLCDDEVAAVSRKRFYPPNCCPWPRLLSPDWLTADTPHSHWPPLAHCDWPRAKSRRTAEPWLDSAGRLSHKTPPPKSAAAPPPAEGLRREEHPYWRHDAAASSCWGWSLNHMYYIWITIKVEAKLRESKSKKKLDSFLITVVKKILCSKL